MSFQGLDIPSNYIPEGAKGGGEGGIRTPDTVARMPHFECGAFNHSATSPRGRGGVFENPATRIYVTERSGGDKAELPLPAGGRRRGEVKRASGLASTRAP